MAENMWVWLVAVAGSYWRVLLSDESAAMSEPSPASSQLSVAPSAAPTAAAASSSANGSSATPSVTGGLPHADYTFLTSRGSEQLHHDKASLPASVQCMWGCRGVCFFPVQLTAMASRVAQTVPSKKWAFAPQARLPVWMGRGGCVCSLLSMQS